MNKSLDKSINSNTIVSVVSIVAIAICCLAAMRYNTQITIEKEKIEVNANQTSIK